MHIARYGAAVLILAALALALSPVQGTWSVTDAAIIDVAAASWEADIVGDPWLLDIGGLHYLFYYGHGANISSIGYATSSSLNGPWAKFSGNPILTHAGKPSIIAIGSTYYMYAESEATARSINLYTSTNLTSWTASGANPILAPGSEPGGSTTVYYVAPSVFKSGSTYYLYYSAQDNTTLKYNIFYATSSDAVSWTKQGSAVPASASGWDLGATAPGSVVLSGSTYWMSYNALSTVPSGVGSESNPSGIGLASSTDLVTWTKHSNNPIIATDTGRVYAQKVWRGHLTALSGEPMIFFNAGDGSNVERIFNAPFNPMTASSRARGPVTIRGVGGLR